MTAVILYNSTICRLCADEDINGELLFTSDNDEPDLGSMVNRYLPLKIEDDGKLPRTICADCNVQLESTIQFFDILVEGQRKIQELHENQLERQKKTELGELRESTENECKKLEEDPLALEIKTEIVPGDAMYSADHEMVLQIEKLKTSQQKGNFEVHMIKEESVECKNQEVEEVEEIGKNGRRKRTRKVPQRFSDVVNEKELERVLQNVATKGSENLGNLVVVKRRRRGQKEQKKTEITCPICGEEFSEMSKYILHKTVHNEVNYGCNECNEQFTSEDTMKLHQKKSGHGDQWIIKDEPEELSTINEESEAIIDETCMSIEKIDVLDDVLQEPTEDSPSSPKSPVFRCDECSKEFKTRKAHEEHMKSHSSEKPFKCTVCKLTFPYESSLRTHKAIHKSEKKSGKGFPCDLCDRVLNHRNSLVYHKETEHNDGRQLTCNECGKSFTYKGYLRRHQLVHSEDRPFACEFCDATFKRKQNLVSHRLKHTGEKKFTCEICNKQFAHWTSLNLHYRWHSGEKPFACPVCKKSFVQNGLLQEHMRIHTGEKPYSCEKCGKTFRTRSQFGRHRNWHTGKKSWTCEVCGRDFLYKDKWRAHVENHKVQESLLTSSGANESQEKENEEKSEVS